MRGWALLDTKNPGLRTNASRGFLKIKGEKLALLQFLNKGGQLFCLFGKFGHSRGGLAHAQICLSQL